MLPSVLYYAISILEYVLGQIPHNQFNAPCAMAATWNAFFVLTRASKHARLHTPEQGPCTTERALKRDRLMTEDHNEACEKLEKKTSA